MYQRFAFFLGHRYFASNSRHQIFAILCLFHLIQFEIVASKSRGRPKASNSSSLTLVNRTSGSSGSQSSGSATNQSTGVSANSQIDTDGGISARPADNLLKASGGGQTNASELDPQKGTVVSVPTDPVTKQPREILTNQTSEPVANRSSLIVANRTSGISTDRPNVPPENRTTDSEGNPPIDSLANNTLAAATNQFTVYTANHTASGKRASPAVHILPDSVLNETFCQKACYDAHIFIVKLENNTIPTDLLDKYREYLNKTSITTGDIDELFLACNNEKTAPCMKEESMVLYIVLGVIGAVIVLAIIIFIVVRVCKKSKKQQAKA